MTSAMIIFIHLIYAYIITYSQKKDCEHSYSQENQKKRNTGSKKLGCTAAVYMREIVFFPEYKVM